MVVSTRLLFARISYTAVQDANVVLTQTLSQSLQASHEGVVSQQILRPSPLRTLQGKPKQSFDVFLYITFSGSHALSYTRRKVIFSMSKGSQYPSLRATPRPRGSLTLNVSDQLMTFEGCSAMPGMSRPAERARLFGE